MKELSIEGKIRKDILKAAFAAGRIGAHIAPSLSIVEICMAALSTCKKDDIFILSKAHGALGYYATMHQLGMISEEQFASFEKNGGEFPGQPSRSDSNKIEYSGGSLGMGLPYASGRAFANRKSRVFVLAGDGEMDEGSNWEAASFISSQKLNNVCLIVDVNGLQSDGYCEDIMGRNLRKIYEAYEWIVRECDGHDVQTLNKVISMDHDKPLIILAKTVKGKGISFMENNNEWHHKELRKEQYDKAVSEIMEKYGL